MDNIKDREKLNILKMVYDNLQVVGYDRVFVTLEDKSMIMDLDGNIINTYKKGECKVDGTFVIKVNNSNPSSTEYEVTSATTGRKIKLSRNKNNLWTDFFVQALETPFLFVTQGCRIEVYNIDLHRIADFDDNCRITDFRKFSVSETETVIGYRVGYSGSWHKMIFDNISKTYRYLDVAELNDSLSLVATDIIREEKERFSFNGTTLNFLRYALCVNGMMVSKSYADISLFPLHLSEIPYMLTYDSDGKIVYQGLIDKKGNQLLSTAFNEIEYFGNNNFILIDEKYVHLYNSETGYRATYIERKRFNKHDTLPIATICDKDNHYYIFDTYGRIYNYEDLTKYWHCEMSEVDNTIIRVTLNYGSNGNEVYKYVDNRLVPLNNFHKIAEARAGKWVKI